MTEATPEEQQRYEDVAARALMFLYDERVAMPLIEMMRGYDEPQEGLGEAGALVFSRLHGAIAAQGRDVPPDMRLAVAAEVMGNLAEIATEAGIHDFMGEGKKDLEGAWYFALDRFRAQEEAAGSIDPVTAQQDAEILRAANESGELEAMLGEGRMKPEPEPQRGLMPGA